MLVKHLVIFFCSKSELIVIICIQNATIFACVWSIGATSDTDSRLKFDTFLKDLLRGKVAEHPIPDSLGKLELSIPDNGTFYDFYFQVNLNFLQISI